MDLPEIEQRAMLKYLHSDNKKLPEFHQNLVEVFSN